MCGAAQGPHGQAAQCSSAEVEAAPSRRVPVAPVTLRDSTLGAAVALEADVGQCHGGPFPKGRHTFVLAPNAVWAWGASLNWWCWGLWDRGLGAWLLALHGSAHQEPWAHCMRWVCSPWIHHPLPQYLLIFYKSCWDIAFQVTEELSAALRLRLESGSEESEEEEEEDRDPTAALEPGQAGRSDAGEAVLERLEALEADVRFLCTELGAEKLLWSSRFLELLREQQSLRQGVSALRDPRSPHGPSRIPDPHTRSQLQERALRWDSGDGPELLGDAEEPNTIGSEGESPQVEQGKGEPVVGEGVLPPGLGMGLSALPWAAQGTLQLHVGTGRRWCHAPALGTAPASASPLLLLLC
ncbi:uncharacterized protein PRD47_011835 isoform 1-T1 [Ara ararauna]